LLSDVERGFIELKIGKAVLTKLDNRNIELTKILFELKQMLDLYRLIGLNVDQIKDKSAGSTFFGFVQKFIIKLYVINICAVYEDEKQYPLNTIPAITKLIKENQIPFKSLRPIQEFVEKHGQGTKTNADPIKAMQEIVENFIDSKKEIFELYKTTRDKEFAHSEAEWKAEHDGLPSYHEMETLLFFGIDFYSMIHAAYVGGGPVQHKNDNRAAVSLYYLLEKAGLENIKKNFDE